MHDDSRLSSEASYHGADAEPWSVPRDGKADHGSAVKCSADLCHDRSVAAHSPGSPVPPSTAPTRLTPAHELLLVGALSIAAVLLLAPVARVSPDSLELLASTRCWAGQAACAGPSLWPPLWPALLVPFARTDLVSAAWLANLIFAGAVGVPLWALTRRLAGSWTARAAALCWALLPAMHHNAAVLDPRPLLWLLTAAVLALGLRAAEPGRSWWPAFLVAALAPLARPEGLLLIPLLALAALLAGLRWRALATMLAAAVAPMVAWSASSGGGRLQHELVGLAWNGLWPVSDFLALVGPAKAGTPYRAFLRQALDLGLDAPAMGVGVSLGLQPDGPLSLLRALLGTVGGLALLGAVGGCWALGKRGWRPRLNLAAPLAMALGLSLLPMAFGQVNQAANIGFLLPGVLALAFVGCATLLPRRWRAASLLAALLVLLEMNLAPWRLPPPRFLEGSESAARMAAWLAENPPPGGRVACTYAGRSVVRSAGLEPLSLPSAWERWQPQPAPPVLLTADLHTDGGRGLQLIEDPAWVPRAWAAPRGDDPTERGSWYLYLEPAP